MKPEPESLDIQPSRGGKRRGSFSERYSPLNSPNSPISGDDSDNDEVFDQKGNPLPFKTKDRSVSPSRRSTSPGGRKKRTCTRWTEEENERLMSAYKKYNGKNWSSIAKEVGNKTSDQCNQHWHRVLDPSISKEKWTTEEDAVLFARVDLLGSSSWKKVSESLPGRTDLQCRHRWTQLTKPKRKKNVVGPPQGMPQQINPLLLHQMQMQALIQQQQQQQQGYPFMAPTQAPVMDADSLAMAVAFNNLAMSNMGQQAPQMDPNMQLQHQNALLSVPPQPLYAPSPQVPYSAPMMDPAMMQLQQQFAQTSVSNDGSWQLPNPLDPLVNNPYINPNGNVFNAPPMGQMQMHPNMMQQHPNMGSHPNQNPNMRAPPS